MSRKTKTMCPFCWHTSEPDSNIENPICAMCRQLVGEEPMESPAATLDHYKKILLDPDIPRKMKDYITFISAATVKTARRIQELSAQLEKPLSENHSLQRSAES